MGDLKGIEISDILGFGKGSVKLLEMVQAGVGTWYKPRSIKREAEAEACRIKALADANAYAVNTLTGACRENSDVPVTYNNGSISITPEFSPEFMERTKERFLYQETTKQTSIENIIELTEQMLIDTPEVSDEPVDKRWAMRFFDSAAEINDEETQKLWAKILAGEIKKKGSFSLRTLEAMKNLSQEEAALFQEYSQYFISINTQSFLLLNEKVNKKFELEFRDLMTLNYAGLMSVTPKEFILTSTHNNYIRHFFTKNVVFLLKWTDSNKSVIFRACDLTSVGSEMLTLASKDSDRNYMKELMRSINKDHHDFTISMHERKKDLDVLDYLNEKNLLDED